MKGIYNVFKPEGFQTVNSYLFVSDPQKEIDFLKKAFWAEEINRSIAPNGDVGNCILKIGNSCFMISQARGEFENMRTALYLYVNDVDTVYKNALENGAIESFPPANMDYEDRQGGVIDPEGNYWWISKRLVEKGYHE
ncbi:VOC family protein [Maribacter algarum]|uniref:VOC family protein n=1 Tax=Maribacter algarum (ex Zhang et al. 2020) TaxID=2578118 RepID=A0A5S3PGT9_9FLAO|nr:VOC family protein [Maribacter algarum]TMM53325.1 VOC family protein [Maribacter algarum]